MLKELSQCINSSTTPMIYQDPMKNHTSTLFINPVVDKEETENDIKEK